MIACTLIVLANCAGTYLSGPTILKLITTALCCYLFIRYMRTVK